MAQTNSDYKFVLIGNSGVGKTSIFRKLSTGEFNESNISTIGVEKKTFYINIENDKKEQKSTNVILFDTAGEEKFRSITKSYYKSSDGILLIYDVTNKETFQCISNWIESIKDSIGSESKYIIFLIGNKLDLINEEGFERQVTKEEAEEECHKLEMIFGGELSTKEIKYEDLTKLFESYVQQIYNKFGEKVNKKQKIDSVGKYKNRRGCCEVAV
jgi:small GTP-binding protein